MGPILDRLAGLPDLEKCRNGDFSPGLGPITALLARLGDPQRGPATVHVAGSKGKGTTVLYLEALLREAGLRTGAYLSPHLVGLEERFRLDGVPVDPSRLAAILERVADGAGGIAGLGLFDALTAGALLLFAEAGVDIALVECGLGGRLDSTNLVDPRVCVITTVEREHEDLLGPGIRRVAAEKAGIIKPGRPLVTGCTGPALEVIRARAGELGVECGVMGRDFGFRILGREEDGYWIGLHPHPQELTTAIRLPGALASLTLAREAYVRLRGGPPPPAAMAAAAHRALPGRCELLPGRPAWLFDGAHTPRSLLRLARAVGEWFAHRPLELVFATAGDKQWHRSLALLSGLAGRTWLVTLPGPRGVAAAEMAPFARGRVECLDDPDRAWEVLSRLPGRDGLILVTGSYGLVGPLRSRRLEAQGRSAP